MRRCTSSLILATLLLTGLAAGQSSSLFQRELQRSAQASAAPAVPNFSLIAVPAPKPRTFARHDLLTIIIREQATNATAGDVSSERSSNIDGSLDAWSTIRGSAPFLRSVDLGATPPAVKGGLDRDFDGSGSISRTDSLTARITGEIIDIKPNGTLVVQASKEVVTDEDRYTITVTGRCRTEDVTPDNTILSTQLAELTVVKTASGSVRDATKRGVIHKVLDWLNVL